MDELLAKLDGYLENTVPAEEFEGELSKLSPEDKSKFLKSVTPEQQAKMGQKSADLLSQIEARRREEKRLGEKKPPESQPTDYGSKLREENVEAAAQDFFKAYSIPEAEQQSYKDLFAKNDRGSVSVPLIFKNFETIYASQNATELLAIRDRYENMKSGAEEVERQGAGNHGGSATTPPDGKSYPQAVHDWVHESKRRGVDITLEQAQKTLNSGMIRRF